MSAEPKVGVLFTEGTNCDQETIEAFEAVGAEAERVHISELEAGSQDLGRYEALAIPGGFSYGDDVASGKVLAVELETQLAEQIRTFTEKKEKPVIGICNGFQVLVKSGLLPEGSIDAPQRITLVENEHDPFRCQWTNLSYNPENNCVFLGDVTERLELQVAHGEGRLVIPSKELRELKEHQQVVFQYINDSGEPTVEYPENPNGSVEGITGVTDRSGRILGMMPHPERSVRPDQHPNKLRFRTKNQQAPADGRQIFEQMVTYIRQG